MGNTCPSGDSYEALTYRPAIILYPALLTPAVITNNQDLEILLLGEKDKRITITHVAHQLKVDTTLHSRKRYQLDSLNPDWIDIEETEVEDEIYATDKQFQGLLHQTVEEEFTNRGYTKLYRVRLNQAALAEGKDGARSLFNLIWVSYDDPEVRSACEEKTGFDMPEETRSHQVNETYERESGEEAVLANEEQDIILRQILSDMQDWQPPEEKIGKFAFYPHGKPEEIDYEEPIQTYHPVFHVEDLGAANIGHITDLHLCARQHAMAESPARVIEYEEETNGERTAGDTDVSPKIGPQINVNLDRFRELLQEVGTDDEIDVLLIGGDLADYIKSFYPGETNSVDGVRDVWEQVGLSDGSNEHYKDFVDFISFFTLIVDFCRDYEKPAFVVSGNHDGYEEPYGIAPWADISGESRRANPGIPADHNLTLYEAILAFGDTYAEQGPNFNFEAEKLKWFFTVLTPFSDYASYLPQQCLVGMEWGNSQDFLDFSGGKLPRTDNVIFDRQLTFFEEVQECKGHRDVVLMSHFTFVSYDSSIPMSHPNDEGPVEGEVEFGWNWSQKGYDQGTFETNRQPMYETHLAKKLKLILTGHSHRRGLYTIRETNPEDNSATTGFYELNRDGLEQLREHEKDGKQDPKIILSDSAGPMPRYNRHGELDGWGGDRPGGTKVTFYQKDVGEDRKKGDIKNIELLETTVRPRFIVAVDYLDLIKEKTVLQKFEARFRKEEERTLESYEFDVEVHEGVRELASIQDIILYARNEFGEWSKVQFVPVQSQEGEERLELQDPRTFRRYFLNDGSTAKSFLAIQFGMNPDYSDRLSQYDFGSYWCFPVDVVTSQNRLIPWRQKCYRIERNNHGPFEMAGPAEIPDFKWRKELYPGLCLTSTED